MGGSLSTTYLGNVAYRTDFSMTTYPTAFELMGFYNNRRQNDPYYTVDGNSRFTSQAAPATHDGVSGFYVGAKQTFWRADGGQAGVRNPMALSVHGSLAHVFEEESASGVASQGDLGVILSAPFRSRPFDSYSVKASWARLTDHEQRLLEDAYSLSSGGGNYRSARDEYALSLDANFVLTDSSLCDPDLPGQQLRQSIQWGEPSRWLRLRCAAACAFDQMLGLNGLK